MPAANDKIPQMSIFLFILAQVDTPQELRDAVANAKPGARILIAPGSYGAGHHFSNVRGQAGKPIVLAAADPNNPPLFESMQLSLVEHVELHDLAFKGAKQNGLNIDDGGTYDKPSHHLVLRNLKISDVGNRGNEDGIKMSGIDDFRVEGCTIENWGTGGGSAIDMVGCHRGVIENNTIRQTRTGGTGVQMKGGCVDISVRKNRFENAGSRAVNIGGSTGLEYFRPPLKTPPHSEAKDIRVEGNTFTGSDAPIAFVGVDGAVVRFNTIHLPNRWAIRILQETTEAGFVPCRKGEFSGNLVVFRSTGWSEGGVNVGPNTEAASFTISKNFWYCVDDPSRSKPKLPVEEKEGVYGRDPMLDGDLRPKSGSPAKGYGASGLK